MLPSELLKKGWCQADYIADAAGEGMGLDYIDHAQAYCMSGAIMASDISERNKEKLRRTVNTIIANTYTDYGMTVWQDGLPYTEESKQKVIGLMQTAEEMVGLKNAT